MVDLTPNWAAANAEQSLTQSRNNARPWQSQPKNDRLSTDLTDTSWKCQNIQHNSAHSLRDGAKSLQTFQGSCKDYWRHCIRNRNLLSSISMCSLGHNDFDFYMSHRRLISVPSAGVVDGHLPPRTLRWNLPNCKKYIMTLPVFNRRPLSGGWAAYTKVWLPCRTVGKRFWCFSNEIHHVRNVKHAITAAQVNDTFGS